MNISKSFSDRRKATTRTCQRGRYAVNKASTKASFCVLCLDGARWHVKRLHDDDALRKPHQFACLCRTITHHHHRHPHLRLQVCHVAHFVIVVAFVAGFVSVAAACCGSLLHACIIIEPPFLF